MKKRYFVRGTFSVRIKGKELEMWLTPSTGFLTPDKKSLIAFPVASSKGKTGGKAKLIRSANASQFKLKATRHVRDHLPGLLAVATQQGTIELRLKEFTKRRRNRITGFVLPAPSDHAHGR